MRRRRPHRLLVMALREPSNTRSDPAANPHSSEPSREFFSQQGSLLWIGRYGTERWAVASRLLLAEPGSCVPAHWQGVRAWAARVARAPLARLCGAVVGLAGCDGPRCGSLPAASARAGASVSGAHNARRRPRFGFVLHARSLPACCAWMLQERCGRPAFTDCRRAALWLTPSRRQVALKTPRLWIESTKRLHWPMASRFTFQAPLKPPFPRS